MEMDQLKQDIADIKTALLGNNFTKNQGLVHKVDDALNRIEQIEEKGKSIKYLFIGLSFGSGVGAAAIIKFLENILK